jgi:hypothetical protein
MSLRDLAHIALRIGAVIIIADILTSLPMAFTAARYYAPAVIRLEILETVLPPYGISLIGAVLMYVCAGKIADWVVLRGKVEGAGASPADIAALERAAVSVLGLYFFIMGLSDVAHSVIRHVEISRAMSNLTYPGSAIVSAPDTAKFGDALFRIVVGCFLIRNGDAFIRLKDKLRVKRGIAGEENRSIDPT